MKASMARVRRILATLDVHPDFTRRWPLEQVADALGALRELRVAGYPCRLDSRVEDGQRVVLIVPV